MSPLKKNKREEILQYFRNVARQENSKIRQISFESLLDDNGKKRFLVVCRESGGDILYATALLKSLSESYKGWDIYFACKQEFVELVENCPYVHRILPYLPQMDSEIGMTGQGASKGFFSGYCNLTIATQHILNYLTNEKIALQLT